MTSTLEKRDSAGIDPEHRTRVSQEFVEPEVNILKTAEGYVLEVEMPGVNKSGLEVTVEGNVLTIVGRRRPVTTPGEPIFRESAIADFRRVFELGPEVDAAAVSGRIERGVLTVTLPKAESAKPRTIVVS